MRALGYAMEDEQSEMGMRSLAAPIRDARHQVTGAIATFTDITARKRAEETQLRANAALEEATHRWPNLHVFDWASIA